MIETQDFAPVPGRNSTNMNNYRKIRQQALVGQVLVLVWIGCRGLIPAATPTPTLLPRATSSPSPVPTATPVTR